MIFKISAPVKVKNGTLIVGVKNNVWLQELSFLKNKLLEKLQAYTPNVKEIQFILHFEFNKDRSQTTKQKIKLLS